MGVTFEILFLSLIGAEIYRDGNPPLLGTSLFGIPIDEGAHFFEIFAPEGVEMNSQRCTEAFAKNCKEKNGVEKHKEW